MASPRRGVRHTVWSTAVSFHLAQYNVGRLLQPLEHESISGFVNGLEPINKLAEASPGFVWRYQTDEGDATALRPYDDDQIIINFSVWTNPDALRAYTYGPEHAAFLKRRREWFEAHVESHLVMWWVPSGSIPTVEEAGDRLEHLRTHGPTERAFTFRTRFDPPEST